MNLTDRATIGLITRSAITAGIKLPKAVADAQTRAEKVGEAANSIATTHEEVAAAVYRVLAADGDPSADPEVQRLVTARALVTDGYGYAVELAAVEDLREVVTGQRDAIVNAFEKPFTAAADDLAQAQQILGDVDLEDAGAVLNSGPRAAEAWANARRALRVVEAGNEMLFALTEFTRTVRLSPSMAPLRMAAIDWPTWAANQWGAGDAKVKPWTLVCAGVRLSLPTIDEYRARVEVINEGQRNAQVEADNRSKNALAGRS